jgi:hypothetical protein
VHNDPVLLDEFDCGAWVTVPHPLDNPEVFRRRLRKELGVARNQDLGQYLREKRYRVIVDDVHTNEEWDAICQVFQFRNSKGSRIIVTTRREDVARHCTKHVYELKPLGDAESMDLLCQKVHLLSFSKTEFYSVCLYFSFRNSGVDGRKHTYH